MQHTRSHRIETPLARSLGDGLKFYKDITPQHATSINQTLEADRQSIKPWPIHTELQGLFNLQGR